MSLRIAETITAMGKPVIAAVHGYASAMGCALAASCDLVIAADSACFQLPGINLGIACISPAAVISRFMNRKKCLELLLTGDTINADEATKAGLVNRVVPSEKLDDAVMELAEKLASKAPLAIELGKQAFYAMSSMEEKQAYSYAAEAISINASTEDGKEGIASFIEKRKPRPWQGR
jgi:enoyl-CoA hydratase/carnithine racemase